MGGQVERLPTLFIAHSAMAYGQGQLSGSDCSCYTYHGSSFNVNEWTLLSSNEVAIR